LMFTQNQLSRHFWRTIRTSTIWIDWPSFWSFDFSKVNAHCKRVGSAQRYVTSYSIYFAPWKERDAPNNPWLDPRLPIFIALFTYAGHEIFSF
jgi:hypothetical protein